MPEPLEVTSRLLTNAEASDADIEACVELLRAAYGDWPPQPVGVSAADHLRWKLDAPAPVPSRAHLLQVHGRLAAFGLYIPKPFRIFGEPLLANDGVDAAVHPDFQGQGLYRKRRELKILEADQEVDFTANYSNNTRIQNYRASLGREDYPGRPQVLTRVRQLWRIPAYLVPPEDRRRVLPLLPAAWRSARTAVGRGRPAPPAGVRFRVAPRFDQRVDALFEAVVPAFDFVQERDAEVLNWRYADPRAGAHTILFAEAGDELLGYTVTRERSGQGYVMDLLAQPGRTDVAGALLAAATARLDGCNAVTTWVTPLHPYEELIRAQGYLDMGHDCGLSMRLITVGEEILQPLTNPRGRVHLMPGDSDWL